MSLKQNDTFEEAAFEAEQETAQLPAILRPNWWIKDYSNVPHGAHNQGIAYEGDDV